MRDFPQEVEGYSVPCLTVWLMPYTLNQGGDTTTRIHGRKLWAMQRHQRKRNRNNKHNTWNHWEFAQNYDQIISLLGSMCMHIQTVPACATAPDHQSSANSWCTISDWLVQATLLSHGYMCPFRRDMPLFDVFIAWLWMLSLDISTFPPSQLMTWCLWTWYPCHDWDVGSFSETGSFCGKQT